MSGRELADERAGGTEVVDAMCKAVGELSTPIFADQDGTRHPTESEDLIRAKSRFILTCLERDGWKLVRLDSHPNEANGG